jgi:SAM-dependent MidA family methyltransferase
MPRPRIITSADEARRIAALFPSYRDFVDDALFHPAWGYYSTGQVRFGEGGHYDTFPLALAPLFGRMVAIYAYRFWRRAGQPPRFEICELGAGNGQLCLDTLIAVSQGARHGGGWRRFAAALRYRIIERSAALIARQRATLGPLAASVTWTRADLSQRAARRTPFAPCGLVFANEVLDCLSHHKVVPRPDGPGVVYVVPSLRPAVGVGSAGPLPSFDGAQDGAGSLQLAKSDGLLVAGLDGSTRTVPRDALATVLADARLRPHVTFEEVALPVRLVPALHEFVHRYYPEFFSMDTFQPYFACPAIPRLVQHAARLYRTVEFLWIDYGDTAAFHLTAPERQRVFAGPPRSGASIYRDPGRDDVTFLVDFTVLAAAAEEAGLRVKFFGPQGELARRTGVMLDRAARAAIMRYRTLGWMLAVAGVGPERAWRHTGLTWSARDGKGGRLRDYINKAVAEFVGKRSSRFKLMIVGPAPAARPSSAPPHKSLRSARR